MECYHNVITAHALLKTRPIMVAMHLVRVASVLITWSIHEGIALSSVDEASSNSDHDGYSFKRNDARKEHLSELYFQFI